MKKEQIIILVISFFVGMLLLHMVKNICGCNIEGFSQGYYRTNLNTRIDNTPNALSESAMDCGTTLGEVCGGAKKYYCNRG